MEKKLNREFSDFKIEQTINSFIECGKSRNRLYLLMVVLTTISYVYQIFGGLIKETKVGFIGISLEIESNYISIIASLISLICFFSWSVKTSLHRVYQIKIRELIKKRYSVDEWPWYSNYPSFEISMLMFRNIHGILLFIGHQLIIFIYVPLSLLLQLFIIYPEESQKISVVYYMFYTLIFLIFLWPSSNLQKTTEKL